MLRTIQVGTCVSVQGLMVRTIDDGRLRDSRDQRPTSAPGSSPRRRWMPDPASDDEALSRRAVPPCTGQTG